MVPARLLVRALLRSRSSWRERTRSSARPTAEWGRTGFRRSTGCRRPPALQGTKLRRGSRVLAGPSCHAPRSFHNPRAPQSAMSPPAANARPKCWPAQHQTIVNKDSGTERQSRLLEETAPHFQERPDPIADQEQVQQEQAKDNEQESLPFDARSPCNPTSGSTFITNRQAASFWRLLGQADATICSGYPRVGSQALGNLVALQLVTLEQSPTFLAPCSAERDLHRREAC